MRILLLHSSSDLYGASKIFLQTVTLLRKYGHQCVVVLSNKGSLEGIIMNKIGDIFIIYNLLGLLLAISFKSPGERNGNIPVFKKYSKSQSLTIVECVPEVVR